ncbi:MAG: LCP family protein [Defluviitaleaceae bacterium]|nr:LCP family protein [Defluviitaleaceae bacterium]
MQNNEKKNNKKTKTRKERSLIQKFFITLGISFAALFAVVSVTAVALLFFDNPVSNMISAAIGLEIDEDGNRIVGGGFGGLFDSGLPERTNILLLGTDEAFGGSVGRADSIMIVTIHSDTGDISLISVPRDTHVTMPQDRLQILRDNGRNTASSTGVMRLNEIAHHAGREFAPSFTAMQIEELLDIEIHYYVHMDLEGFRFIIDQIGGIEFDVPRRMNYRDPYQDLIIDLHPGVQLLMGHDAEGLVRYRASYGDGDLGRMRVQQDFMMEAAIQIMDMDNILSNPLAYLSVFLNHIDTNFGLMDAPPYLSLLGSLDVANMTAVTLPGRGTTINGRYFHILDEEGVEEIVAQFFHTTPEILQAEVIDDSPNNIANISSLGLDIEILNGAGITGLAARTSETLTNLGYNIVSIGDYTGQRQSTTRILVQQEGGGQDLKNHLPDNTIIEIDRGIDADIVIILGTTGFEQ